MLIISFNPPDNPYYLFSYESIPPYRCLEEPKDFLDVRTRSTLGCQQAQGYQKVSLTPKSILPLGLVPA